MPHLAPRAHRLAVPVEVGAGKGKDLGEVRFYPDEVGHGAIAPGGRAPQGEAQKGPKVVLKLACLRPFYRPVAGVVHPGSHLVEEELLPHLEELQGQDAHVAQGLEGLPGVGFRLLLQGLRKPGGGGEGEAEDPPLVVVFHQGIKGQGPVPPPHGEEGDLPVKGDEALQEEAFFPQGFQGLQGLAFRAHQGLPLAVVPPAAGLEEGGKAHRLQGLLQVPLPVHGVEGRGGNSERPHEGLFLEAVLGHLQGLGGRENGEALGQTLGRLHRDVFKLVGHEVQALGEAGEGLPVQVVSHHQLPHLPGAGLRAWVQEAEGKAQGIARKGQHPPQLAAAQDADPHASSRGSGWARTASVWAWR